MNRLFVGCAVALMLVNSFPATHAAEPPQATPGATAQTSSPGIAPVLKPGVWTNLTPAATKMKDSNRRMFCQGCTVDPQNPATIYVCVCSYDLTEGIGLYKTTDSGTTWKRIGPFDEPIHVVIDSKDSNHLYCVDGVRGSTKGFWVSFDGGETWKQPAGLIDDTKTPLGNTDMYSAAADPTDFNHVLVSFHSTMFWGPWKGKAAAGIVESWDGGEHWKAHDVPTKEDCSGSGCSIFFLYDPVKKIGDAKTWLFTAQVPDWYRTEDGGVSWTQVYDKKMTHGGQQLYRASNNVLYAGGFIYPVRSTDNGKSWTTLTKDNGLPYGCYMGICGDGKNIVCASRNPTGRCYYSSLETDGLTWKPYLPDQKFTMEPFELRYDAKNGIMYATPWFDGFWALKIGGG